MYVINYKVQSMPQECVGDREFWRLGQHLEVVDILNNSNSKEKNHCLLCGEQCKDNHHVAWVVVVALHLVFV